MWRNWLPSSWAGSPRERRLCATRGRREGRRGHRASHGGAPGAAAAVRAPGVGELRAERVRPPRRWPRARAVAHALQLEARTAHPLGQAVPGGLGQASAPATPFLPLRRPGPAARGPQGHAAHESRCGSGCGRPSTVQRQDCPVDPKDTHSQNLPQPLGTPRWARGARRRVVGWRASRAMGGVWTTAAQGPVLLGPSGVMGGPDPTKPRRGECLYVAGTKGSGCSGSYRGWDRDSWPSPPGPATLCPCGTARGGWRSATCGRAHVHTAADDASHSRGQREGQHRNQVCSQALAATPGQVKVRAPQWRRGRKNCSERALCNVPTK